MEGPRAKVLGYPLCHPEIRVAAASSLKSMGMDADRLEFRFRSSGDKLDVACSQLVCAPMWLVCARSNAAWCRKNLARDGLIKRPNSHESIPFAQHRRWTAPRCWAQSWSSGGRVPCGQLAFDVCKRVMQIKKKRQ